MSRIEPASPYSATSAVGELVKDSLLSAKTMKAADIVWKRASTLSLQPTKAQVDNEANKIRPGGGPVKEESATIARLREEILAGN